MRIMSVDYGDTRTGIAFCDAKEILASAYCVIEEKYFPKLVDKILEIAENEKAEKIVIGLPRNMDGSYGFRAEKCKNLGEVLKNKTETEIVYEDERLTTVIAHDYLSDNNVRGKKRKSTVDAVSAAVILQSYLDKNR